MDMENLDSRIDSVCLFRQGAKVIRSASLTKTSQGANVVKVLDFPLSLQDESVQVEIPDDNVDAVSIIDINVGLELAEYKSENKAELEKQLEKVMHEEEEKTSQLDSLKKNLGSFSELSLIVRENIKGRKPELVKYQQAGKELGEFRRKNIDSLQQQCFSFEQELEELEQKRKKLEREIKKIKKRLRPDKLKKAIFISYLAQKENKDIPLKISYHVPGARWIPVYALKLAENCHQGQLIMRAKVVQQTGEEWENVRMNLSTANLANWTEIPELKAIRIGRQKEVGTPTWFPPPLDTEQLFNDYDLVFGRKPEPTKKRTEEKQVHPHTQPLPQQARSGEPACLIVLSEQLRGERFELDMDCYSIGKGVSNHIILKDPSIHNVHCEIYWHNNHFYLKRLVSGNTLKINNIDVKLANKLENTDIIQIGNLELLYDTNDKSESLVLKTQTGINLHGAEVSKMDNFAPAFAGGALADEGVEVEKVVKAKKGSAPFAKTAKVRAAAALATFSKEGAVDSFLEEPVGEYRCQISEKFEAVEQFESFFSYNYLRLPNFHESSRGNLRIHTITQLYLEQISEYGFATNDIDDILSKSQSVAGNIDTRTEAFGFPFPSSWQGFDYIYEANLSVSVPNDGNFHSISVGQYDLQVFPLHIAVPSQSQQVFRTVTATNPLPAALMAGPVDVYLGNDFLLTSDLDVCPPNSQLSIGIGVAQDVKISRNVQFKEESSGLMHGSRDLLHEVVIEVQNYTSESVDLSIRERLPVTYDEEKEIKVKLKDVIPAWKEFKNQEDSLKSGYCWEFDLPPGNKSSMSYEYIITIPAKKELVGGNRREG